MDLYAEKISVTVAPWTNSNKENHLVEICMSPISFFYFACLHATYKLDVHRNQRRDIIFISVIIIFFK